jgi:hypothetical protein
VDREMVKLALYAAKGNLKLLHNCYSTDAVELLAHSFEDVNDSVSEQLKLQNERYEAMTCNFADTSVYTSDDSGIYNRCWALLFHLKFADAVDLLEKWNPKSVFDKARKSILLIMEKLFTILK